MTDHTTPLRRANAGFSLIELLIVLVIVSVGILALSGVQTRSSRDVDATGRHIRAIQLAKTRIEVARAAGYLLAVPDSGLVGVFTWNTRVDSVAIGLRKLTVTVSYAEKGAPRSVRLEDMVASR